MEIEDGSRPEFQLGLYVQSALKVVLGLWIVTLFIGDDIFKHVVVCLLVLLFMEMANRDASRMVMHAALHRDTVRFGQRLESWLRRVLPKDQHAEQDAVTDEPSNPAGLAETLIGSGRHLFFALGVRLATSGAAILALGWSALERAGLVHWPELQYANHLGRMWRIGATAFLGGWAVTFAHWGYITWVQWRTERAATRRRTARAAELGVLDFVRELADGIKPKEHRRWTQQWGDSRPWDEDKRVWVDVYGPIAAVIDISVYVEVGKKKVFDARGRDGEFVVRHLEEGPWIATMGDFVRREQAKRARTARAAELGLLDVVRELSDGLSSDEQRAWTAQQDEDRIDVRIYQELEDVVAHVLVNDETVFHVRGNSVEWLEEGSWVLAMKEVTWETEPEFQSETEPSPS